MAIESTGYIIEIPGSTQQPKIFTFGELKSQVADRLNASGDVEILEVAGRGIRWAIAYAELTRNFTFRGNQTSAIAPTLNGNTIAIPTDFLGVREVRRLYTAGSITGDLQVGDVHGIIPFEPYNKLMARGDVYGNTPTVWTIRNSYEDEYIIHWPKAKQKMLDDWTIQIDHDTPIGLPDSDTDILDAPQNFAITLVEGGKLYALRERKPEDTFSIADQRVIFETMIARYSAHERQRHGRKSGQWSVGRVQ